MTDIDAVIERANGIASWRDHYIFGRAHAVLSHLFGEQRQGLCYDTRTHDAYTPAGRNARLLALAFGLTLLHRHGKGTSQL